MFPLASCFARAHQRQKPETVFHRHAVRPDGSEQARRDGRHVPSIVLGGRPFRGREARKLLALTHIADLDDAAANIFTDGEIRPRPQPGIAHGRYRADAFEGCYDPRHAAGGKDQPADVEIPVPSLVSVEGALPYQLLLLALKLDAARADEIIPSRALISFEAVNAARPRILVARAANHLEGYVVPVAFVPFAFAKEDRIALRAPRVGPWIVFRRIGSEPFLRRLVQQMLAHDGGICLPVSTALDPRAVVHTDLPIRFGTRSGLPLSPCLASARKTCRSHGGQEGYHGAAQRHSAQGDLVDRELNFPLRQKVMT